MLGMNDCIDSKKGILEYQFLSLFFDDANLCFSLN